MPVLGLAAGGGRAVGRAGQPSIPPTFTPGSIGATVDDAAVTISELQAPANGAEPYVRNLYRSTTEGVKGSEIDADTTLPYVDTDVVNDTEYWYTLEVVDDDSNSVDTPQISATPSTETGVFDALPSGWVLADNGTYDAEWDNKTSLANPYEGWSMSSIPTINGTSAVVSSGYGDSPPVGGPNVREGSYFNNGEQCASAGRLGFTFGARTAVACVHVFKIPSTYPYSNVFGGNKVQFFNVGTGDDRAFTVWRAAAPAENFDDDIADRTDERKLWVTMEGTSPVGSDEGTPGVEIELDQWIVSTLIMDNRLGAGAGIIRHYVKVGSGAHQLNVEHTNLTFADTGTFSGGYVEHTNNGFAGQNNRVPFDGSFYDAYIGFYVPPE